MHGLWQKRNKSAWVNVWNIATGQQKQGTPNSKPHALSPPSGFAFFGVRRFSAACFLWFSQRKKSKESGGKAPHSTKKSKAPTSA
jgi:hypothetical protein